MKDNIDNQVVRSSTIISFHKFQLLKNKCEYAFFFVEGEDDKLYYPSKSRSKLPNKQILPLVRGGKKGVMEVYELTKEFVNKKIIAGYFIDGDFDDKYNKEVCKKIYITPCYSVENLVFNKSTFVNILHEKFGLNFSDKEYAGALAFYEDRTSEFYSALKLYNGWMYAQRNLPKEKKRNNVNFFKNLPDNFVKLSKNEILADYTHEDIITLHPCAPELSEHEINKCIDIIGKDNPEYRYRGKFHWLIFSFVLACLIDDANDKKCQDILKHKVKFSFSRNDKRKFFEETYHFSKIPNCLSRYFDGLAA